MIENYIVDKDAVYIINVVAFALKINLDVEVIEVFMVLVKDDNIINFD